MRALVIALLPLVACQGRAPNGGTGGGAPSAGACISDADCPPSMWCLYQRCSDRAAPFVPPIDTTSPAISAAPAALSFGIIEPPTTRTLSVVLSNVGDTMLTIESVTITPPGSPFAVEHLGYGPFWIRPGRSRDVFVTCAPASTAHQAATLSVLSQADTQYITLLAN
ncbi:MAG: hypothetical protein HY903_13660 [Deltaproteobacteria bacterium]|nr:hypothetical protein [Deltaproteobacteria bacterium]